MGSADQIHPDVLTECLHFAHKKINGLITQSEKKRVIFKCLLKAEFSEADLKEQLPEYAEDEAFRDVWGMELPRPLSWREFRIIVLMSFARFLNRKMELAPYLSQRANTLEECTEILLSGGAPQWKLYLPRVLKIGRRGLLRRLFQLCKKTPTIGPEANIKLQIVVDIMRRYTVEDPLELLVTIFPEFSPAVEGLLKTKCVDRVDEQIGVIYHVLNAYINWFTFNRNQFLNPGIQLPTTELPESAQDTAYDLRCGGCWRLLSIRSLRKVGNPKTMEIYYSTDNHSLISACCKTKVLKVPLTVGDTGLVINTPFKQQYHICPCGCAAVVYNDLPV
ncbi:ORF44 [black bullhead herpesvirus]|uniref:ORF44 n=1 Tax=black bullhead herpesvirus TaxID=508441 RepID=A0A2H5AJI6_9VIRU|nr:ORF44 [black bullhead herpesvirus]AUG72297.1 ORF44 [black bullhead herpesvirus]